MASLRKPAHREHMLMLLVVFIVLTVLSYLIGFKTYFSLPDPGIMQVILFSLVFLDTVLLIIMASFLLKIYEQIYK